MRAQSVRLKGCPRCRGDLFLEHEAFGWNLSCLQCGYTRWLEPAGTGGEEPAEAAVAVEVSALEKEKIAA